MFEDEVYPPPDDTPNLPFWLAEMSTFDLIMISGAFTILIIIAALALFTILPEYMGPATDCLNAVCV